MLASTAPFLQTASSLVKSSFLTAISSKAASITKSTSEKLLISRLPSRLDSTRSNLSCDSFPRLTAPFRFLVMVAKPRSRFSWAVSSSLTDKPDSKQAVAMPDPMVPPPIIPILAISRVSPLASGILLTARSPKKACIRPALCGVSIHSIKACRSTFRPSSKGKLEARTASTHLCGENKWALVASNLASISSKCAWFGLTAI